MELQQLRYVAEVARSGSISRAARRLYMGQPNLSKAIKEVEEEVGRPLFRRTSQGVEPTRAGEDFLYCAREVLAQMDRLEALYAPRENAPARLSVWMPRASYLAAGYAQWLHTLSDCVPDLQLRETAGSDTLQAVLRGEAQLGILRYESRYARYFESVVQAHGLHHAPLWEYHMQVLMSADHPLAHLQEIPPHRLDEYPMVVHGDTTPILPPEQAERPAEPRSAGQIAIFDRAAEFAVLRHVRGSFMWASPVPARVLHRQTLCQRPCPGAPLYRDAAVWQGALPALASSLLDAVQRQIASLIAGT